MVCYFLQRRNMYHMELVELYIHLCMDHFYWMDISRKDFSLGLPDGYGMMVLIIKANYKIFNAMEGGRKFMGSIKKEWQRMP